jgi:predicted small secreted protein
VRRILVSAFLACSALFLVVSVGGCNTTEGFGEDVEAAGEKIDQSAEKRGADRD